MSKQYNPDVHHRRSIRLRDHDYSQAGVYFVTLCTFQRKCLFGEIKNGKMRLNEFGRIVEGEWFWTAFIRPEIGLDAYVVMPNHLHGIIIINRTDTPSPTDQPVGATRRVALPEGTTPPENNPTHISGPTSGSVGAIIGQFKAVVTRQINSPSTIPRPTCLATQLLRTNNS